MELNRKGRVFALFQECCIAGGMVLIYLLLSPLLNQMYIWDAYAIFHTLQAYGVKILLWASAAVFAVFLIRKRGKVCWQAILPAFGLFAVYLIINHVLGIDNERWSAIFQRTMVMMFLVVMVSSSIPACQRTFRALSLFYIALALLNGILKIWPDFYLVIGPWKYEAFIASDNASAYPLMFGMLFALLDAHYNQTSVRLWIYAALFFVNQGLLWCATALIGAGFLFLFFLPPVRKVIQKCPAWVFLAVVLLLFAALMWFLFPFLELKPIRFLIEKLLHKDLTLSARSYIWSDLLSLVYEKPFFGHGLAPSATIYYESALAIDVHAHNIFLQCLYEGGLTAFCAAVGVLTFSCHVIDRRTDPKLGAILKFTLFIFLVMQQTDLPAYWSWYMILMVCCMAIALPDLPEGEASGHEEHQSVPSDSIIAV